MALVLFVVFLALMIAIGVWGLRKTASLNDYMLGGRSIGPWVSALAYGTTYFSAVLFIGFAGKVGWKYGYAGLVIGLANAIFGALLAWLVLGARTRRMTQNLGAMTMPEFFAARYQSQRLKPLAAIIIFVFLLPYTASVFQGLSYLFEQGFHISYDTALILMTVVTGVYLVLGGYFAVTLTDFIQGIIMFFGALAMVIALTCKAAPDEPATGLLTQAMQTLQQVPTRHATHVPALGNLDWLMLGALAFMTSFGTWGMPQMVQKFYAIKDEKQVRRAAVVTTVFALVIGGCAYVVGAMSHLFTDKLPLNAAGKPAVDQLIPEILVNHLPEPLMALVLLLVLSASMSTLASLILVASSSVAIDLYMGHLNPKVDKKFALTMMRFLSAVFVALSYFIAKNQFALIATLMSLSWGAIAGAFLAPFLLGLYWKRVTKPAVYVGILTGLTINITLFFLLPPAYAPLNACLAMLAPFVVMPLVTLLTTAPDAAVLKKAFAQIDAAAAPAAPAHPEPERVKS